MLDDVRIAAVGIGLAARLKVVLEVSEQDVCLVAFKMIVLDVSGSSFASLLVLFVLGSGSLEGVPLLVCSLVGLDEFLECRDALPRLNRSLVSIDIFMVGSQFFVFDVGCLCCDDGIPEAREVVEVDAVVAIKCVIDNAFAAVGRRIVLLLYGRVRQWCSWCRHSKRGDTGSA